MRWASPRGRRRDRACSSAWWRFQPGSCYSFSFIEGRPGAAAVSLSWRTFISPLTHSQNKGSERRPVDQNHPFVSIYCTQPGFPYLKSKSCALNKYTSWVPKLVNCFCQLCTDLLKSRAHWELTAKACSFWPPYLRRENFHSSVRMFFTFFWGSARWQVVCKAQHDHYFSNHSCSSSRVCFPPDIHMDSCLTKPPTSTS